MALCALTGLYIQAKKKVRLYIHFSMYLQRLYHMEQVADIVGALYEAVAWIGNERGR